MLFRSFVAVILVGVFAGGTPNMADNPEISLYGQTLSAVIMALLGFVPGYGLSLLLKKLNVLRVPEAAEDIGIDEVEILAKPYPESTTPASVSSEVPNKLANTEPQGI